MAAIHLFGGTSDARALCAVLDQLQLDYSVSVATDTGRELAGDIGGSVHVGRLDEPAMIDWLATRGVKWVIDAAHPYASALHANIRAACQALDLRLLRFERPSEIESIVHPLLTVVDDIAAACEVARSLGERVLLGANSGIGISLGDDCVVEAGLYVTAGTKVTLADGAVVKARELSGQNDLLFLRDSVHGNVRVLHRRGSKVELNSELHNN